MMKDVVVSAFAVLAATAAVTVSAETLRYQQVVAGYAGFAGRNDLLFPQNFTLPGFDPVLGRLNDAKIDLTAHVSSRADWSTSPMSTVEGNINFHRADVYFQGHYHSRAYSIDNATVFTDNSPASYGFIAANGQSGSFSGSDFLTVTRDEFTSLELFVEGPLSVELSQEFNYYSDYFGPNYFLARADIAGQAEYVVGVTYTYAVPEPSTWAMMLTGFGSTGSVVRLSRRRKNGSFLASISHS